MEPTLDATHDAPRGGSDRVRILFLSANPRDTSRIAVGEEFHEIESRLRSSARRDRFDLVYAHEVRIDEIGAMLLRHAPDIVHLSAHASEEGELLLPDESGRSVPADARTLAEVFSAALEGVRLRCVLLNMCFSSKLARALSRDVECVIGAPSQIKDKAAVSFAGAFYEALGYGRDVDAAYRYACAEVRLSLPLSGSLPSLFCAEGVRPESVRFDERVSSLDAAMPAEQWLRIAFGGRWGRWLRLSVVFLVMLAFLSGFGLHALIAIAGAGTVAWGCSLAARTRSPKVRSLGYAGVHATPLVITAVSATLWVLSGGPRRVMRKPHDFSRHHAVAAPSAMRSHALVAPLDVALVDAAPVDASDDVALDASPLDARIAIDAPTTTRAHSQSVTHHAPPAPTSFAMPMLARREGFGDCDGERATGTETNLMTDVRNCGVCGHACEAPSQAIATCESGRCAFTCVSGFADCDGLAATGCEARLSSDVANCGRCGLSCGDARYAHSRCVQGRCRSDCEVGFGDCNDLFADGCETRLEVDARHCGACNHACRAGERCEEGRCTSAARASGATNSAPPEWTGIELSP